MIEYEKVKDILYNSKEIECILDSWKEGVPFLIDYNNELCDAFLFFSDSKKKPIILQNSSYNSY